MEKSSEHYYDEWLKLVSDSLKTGTIDELYKSKDGLDIKPFLSYKGKEPRPLKKQSLSWLIGVSFNEQNTQKLNEEIHHFLNLGAESIKFEFSSSEALKSILEGVNTDWIYTDIQSGLTSDIFGPEARGAANFSNHDRFHTLTTESKASSTIDSLIDICRQIDKALTNKQGPESIRISLTVDSYMPISISKLRAMRILWLNLLKKHQAPLIPAFISCHAVTVAEDSNIGLIELSCSALNAVFGGCDILYLDGSNFDRNEKRLAMNIQHILKMESKLDRVMDPLAGSYNIGDLTAQIAEQVWDKM